MTVDDCITAYKRFGEDVFGSKPIGGNATKVLMGVLSKAFYSTEKL
jgi:hypothetical protein